MIRCQLLKPMALARSEPKCQRDPRTREFVIALPRTVIDNLAAVLKVSLVLVGAGVFPLLNL